MARGGERTPRGALPGTRGWPAGGRAVVSPRPRPRLNGEPQVVLGAPIFGPRGEIVGVLAGTLNLFRSNFLGNIRLTRVSNTGSVSLFHKHRMFANSVI